jgi:hypothetical protein
VLVSATGLEFAYSQTSQTMKGVIMAFWYLSITVRNLWVLLVNASVRNETVISRVAETGLTENAFLMFFFAGFARSRLGGMRGGIRCRITIGLRRNEVLMRLPRPELNTDRIPAVFKRDRECQ